MVFESGDICVIVDISIRSSHHQNKNSFIGKRVKFADYTHPIVNCNGFMQCELYAKDLILLPARTIWPGQKFFIYGVKLEKISDSNNDDIRM